MNLPEEEKVYILAGTTGEYTSARQRMELVPKQAYWVTRVSNLKGLQAPRVYRVGTWRNLVNIDEIEKKLKEIKANVEDID